MVGLNCAPEPTGIAPYTTGLAEGLAGHGARVRVLTGYPHYPEWRVSARYRGATLREEINGITVTRLRHHVPRQPLLTSRLHMELSFGVRAVLARWGDADVVLAVSPALFATALVVLKARLTGRRVGVWVQDLYGLGFDEVNGSGSVAGRLLRDIEGRILRAATGVVVIHERFRGWVVDELAVPGERVRVIRNWSHVTIPEVSDRPALRRRLGWDDGEVIALHAGNMGMKQDLENVIEAAREADRTGSRVRFVLLGHGNRRARLEAAAVGVGHVTFADPLPGGEFEEALCAADVLLVNELPGVRGMSVPSKLTSYFAAAVPVVAAVEADSATADEIAASGAGIRVDSGDPAALLAAIERVAADPVLAARCAVAGPAYARDVLGADQALAQFNDWLAGLDAGDHPAEPLASWDEGMSVVGGP